MRIAVVLAWTLGCGRIGYDVREAVPGDGAAGDDAASDSPVASCPAGTTPIMTGARICVEQIERGNDTWTVAKATCEGLGRRLCGDLEWATACSDASGLVDMANDGGGATPDWEWMADRAGAEALKRGFDSCEAMSSHEVLVDPYDYRCCVDI